MTKKNLKKHPPLDQCKISSAFQRATRELCHFKLLSTRDRQKTGFFPGLALGSGPRMRTRNFSELIRKALKSLNLAIQCVRMLTFFSPLNMQHIEQLTVKIIQKFSDSRRVFGPGPEIRVSGQEIFPGRV